MFVNNIEKNFQTVVANFTGVTRHDQMGGRDYLVAPMVMMLEGVLKGSKGPIFYSENEISKYPSAWNSKPVVVYHPQSNGRGVTACDPDIITNHGVGTIMNTRWEDGKLKAEAWLEVDRMDVVDDRIMEAIENNKVMELSTGLFIECDNEAGEWEGKDYIGSATNFQPDHLALLPDLKGACSVDDGAGFLLNQSGDTFTIKVSTLGDGKFVKYLEKNAEHVGRVLRKWTNELVENDMSHSNIRSLLSSALRAGANNDDLWIDEVYDDFFIYEDDGKLFKRDYIVKDGKVVIEGTAVEVVRVTEFRSLDGSFIGNNRKDQQMDKKKVVDGLIADKRTAWQETDRESLMAMNESLLEKLVVNDGEEDKGGEANKAEEAKAEEAKAGDANKAEEAKAGEAGEAAKEKEAISNMSVKDYLKTQVPKGIRSVLQNALKIHDTQKEKFVAEVLANKSNTFTKEFLESKDLEELSNLVALAGNSNPEQINSQLNRFDYSGQSNTIQNIQTKGEPLALPSLA